MSNQKKKRKLLTAGRVLDILLAAIIVALIILSYTVFEKFSSDYYVETEEVPMYVMKKEKEVMLEKDRYGNPVEVRHFLVYVQEDEVEDYRYDSGVVDNKKLYKLVDEGDKVMIKKSIYKKKKNDEVFNTIFEFIDIIED